MRSILRKILHRRWLTFRPNKEPFISLVVIIYNMEREAPRTLYTLTPEYQNRNPDSYEVLVIDNGSTTPFGKQRVEAMSKNFRYFYLNNAAPSPAYALNWGARHARGECLGFMIDGARMLSPGILYFTQKAFKAYKNPVINTLAFHLGEKIQKLAMLEGYNQQLEDILLDSVPWRENGYALFNISCFAGSSKYGWFAPIAECNCIFLRRTLFNQMNGFDEGFDLPGGGLVNLDFYKRAVTFKGAEPIMILGEGSFHQFHNGSMTGKVGEDSRKEMEKYRKQYLKLTGQEFEMPFIRYEYLGHTPSLSFKFMEESLKGVELLKTSFPKEAEVLMVSSINSMKGSQN
ncbi:MAG TPA: glycosyltransferase family A protein [Saprospiraceae bacterium]|nr:glycosyltransferase family A protein [Saprospiraceae bacterium]